VFILLWAFFLDHMMCGLLITYGTSSELLPVVYYVASFHKQFSPLKTEGIWKKIQQVIQLAQKWRFKKIMVPPESLSQYLSNKYQCYACRFNAGISSLR
jgi:hypothetical protein